VTDALPTPGYTTADLAARWRIGQGKILAWIRSGGLPAVNVAATVLGRARFVVLPEAVLEFERRRSTLPPPRQARRKKTTQQIIDFYPDRSQDATAESRGKAVRE
jgi:hypothetical protein